MLAFARGFLFRARIPPASSNPTMKPFNRCRHCRHRLKNRSEYHTTDRSCRGYAGSMAFAFQGSNGPTPTGLLRAWPPGASAMRQHRGACGTHFRRRVLSPDSPTCSAPKARSGVASPWGAPRADPHLLWYVVSALADPGFGGRRSAGRGAQSTAARISLWAVPCKRSDVPSRFKSAVWLWSAPRAGCGWPPPAQSPQPRTPPRFERMLRQQADTDQIW
jgi:hypothetical protein